MKRDTFCPLTNGGCKREQCVMFDVWEHGTYILEDMGGAIMSRCPDYQPVHRDHVVEINGRVCD